jgi:hypothetical protein
MRVDLEKEMRSLIEDSLEDEAARCGRDTDEEIVVEVLKRTGPPESAAAAYLPPRYLIGPELYPHFINTLRIVLSIVAVLAALGIGVSAGVQAESSVFELIGQVISGLVGALFQAAGIVVVIFAILQYTQAEIKTRKREWDPRRLYAEPDPEKVNFAGAMAEIVFTVLALVIFNFYSRWIGFSTIQNGEWVHIPVLTQAFFRYLPVLSVVWVLQIGLHVWLSAKGSWTEGLRWASVAHSALTVGVLAWMATGPAIAALPVEEAAALFEGLTVEAAGRVNEGLATSVRLILGLVIALELVEAGKQLFKLLRSRLPEPLMAK